MLEYPQFVPALGLKKLYGHYQYHQCTECNFGSCILNLDNYFTSSVPRRRNMHGNLDLFFYPRSGNRTQFSCQLNLIINFHLSRLLHRLFPFILEHHSRLLHDSFRQILHLHFPVFHHYLHQFVRSSLKLSITYIFNALVCVTRKMIKKMHKSTKTTLIYQLKTIDFRIALCPRWR